MHLPKTLGQLVHDHMGRPDAVAREWTPLRGALETLGDAYIALHSAWREHEQALCTYETTPTPSGASAGRLRAALRDSRAACEAVQRYSDTALSHFGRVFGAFQTAGGDGTLWFLSSSLTNEAKADVHGLTSAFKALRDDVAANSDAVSRACAVLAARVPPGPPAPALVASVQSACATLAARPGAYRSAPQT